MVTQEDVELAYQEAMMNMARLNRTGAARAHLAGVGQLSEQGQGGRHFRLCGPQTVSVALIFFSPHDSFNTFF